jgi:acyl carrier protein
MMGGREYLVQSWVAAPADTYIMTMTMRGIGISMPGYTRNLIEAQPMSDKASLMQQPAPLAGVGLQRELATLFVRALNLEVAPEEIEPDAPLYGTGLGLDSIDILEVALLVSKQYGIQLRADSQENQQIFRSLRHLAEYIAAQRTK